jgi:poly(beta-D-mannuronate) lyase
VQPPRFVVLHGVWGQGCHDEYIQYKQGLRQFSRFSIWSTSADRRVIERTFNGGRGRHAVPFLRFNRTMTHSRFIPEGLSGLSSSSTEAAGSIARNHRIMLCEMTRGAISLLGGLLAWVVAPASSLNAATYQVGSIESLAARINIAVAGDTVVVSNGVYATSAPIEIRRAGTAAMPIIIRAQTVGGVEITGTDGFNLNEGARYVTIEGFKFTHAASIEISHGASHCRLTRNLIELSIPAGEDVSYVNIRGDDIQIDYNELRNKSTLGNMLDVTGSETQVARRLWVHHNYFHDFTKPGGNGAETIRWGLSRLSLSTGNGLCEYNLFVRCSGENEMISNKSSGNTYRYNTMIDCPGGEISQRHGNDCLYYGNYLRNTQGIRVFGDRHMVFSNYLEGNSIGVHLGNGDGDVYNGSLLTAHDRPDDNVIAFNTFIDNRTHYQMGDRRGGLGSSNTVVANNIFLGGGTMASVSRSAPYTGSWNGNIHWHTASVGNMPGNGYTNANPKLAPAADGVLQLQPDSPAIGAARGSFPFATVDMEGQARDFQPDVGADELSALPTIARFLTTNDVGPAARISSRTLDR